MLNVPPPPFPTPDSYALYPSNGEMLLARIRQVGGDGTAFVLFPAAFGASGSKTVPLADLVDGTPLTAAERAELAALEARFAGKAVSERNAGWRRARALADRHVAAATMARLMQRAGLRPLQAEDAQGEAA